MLGSGSVDHLLCPAGVISPCWNSPELSTTAPLLIIIDASSWRLEQVKKRLGEYGEPLMVGEYKQLRMMFDSGWPAMFWLFADTDGLYDLQAVIQVSHRVGKFWFERFCFFIGS